MLKQIKAGQLQDNPWQILDGESVSAPITGQALIPLEHWLANPSQFDNANTGVWLSCDTDPSLLSSKLCQLPAIAVVFGAFADGRGFSLARILREDCDFTGDLQAAGSYIQDQLFYLKRCGFNTFNVAEGTDVDSMLESLNDFSNSYQASCDEPRPLFRRR